MMLESISSGLVIAQEISARLTERKMSILITGISTHVCDFFVTPPGPGTSLLVDSRDSHVSFDTLISVVPLRNIALVVEFLTL